jgi:hypothetical protein
MSDLTSGVLVATLVAVAGSVGGALLIPRVRGRYWKTFIKREIELSRSWDGLRENGLRLTYPKGIKRFAWATLIVMEGGMFGPLLLVVLSDLDPSSPIGLTIIGLVLTSLACACVPSVLLKEAYGNDIEVSSSGLKKKGLLSRGFFASWEEVQSISYNRWRRSYVVETSRGRIRVVPVLQGIGFFLKTVPEKVPLEKRCPLTCHPINRLIIEKLGIRVV